MPYWRLAGVYFAYFAVVGAMTPYWPLYLQSLNFSVRDIGVLAAIPMLTKLFAPNVWGWMADRYGQRHRVMRWGSCAACLVFAGLMFATEYWSVLLLLLCYSVMWNAVLPQFEATTLAYLDKRSQDYSKVRMWGSIGFIASVLALGQVFEWLTLRYLPLVITLLLAAIFIAAQSLPEPPRRIARGSLRAFFSRLFALHVTVFFLLLFFQQFSHGVYYAFYSIFLAEHGYSKAAIGIFWTLGVLSEIVIFLYMPRLFRCFSRYRLLTVSLALSAVRWLLIATFPEQVFILVTAQLLHALSFGVVHALAIDFIHSTFGDEAQGQAQAFYSAVSFGGGAALGAFVGGVIWQYSPIGSFYIAAFAALISCVLGVVFLRSRM